jgi:preprotein translocase subunit SecD
MPQITLTLDFTPENVDALKSLAETLNRPGAKPAQVEGQLSLDDVDAAKKDMKKSGVKDKKADANPAEDKKPASPKEEAAPEEEKPVYTKDDVYTEASKLAKAKKQAVLKKIFAKYGAEKLSDIAEEHYNDLMADLAAANG